MPTKFCSMAFPSTTSAAAWIFPTCRPTASSAWNSSAAPTARSMVPTPWPAWSASPPQHGDTPLPLFTFGADGGTFGTYHEDGSVGGYWKRLDYFSGYSGFGTQNGIPDSQYHRDVYLGNLRVSRSIPTPRLRATVRALPSRTLTRPTQIAAYGIPDDAADQSKANTDFRRRPWRIAPAIAGTTCCSYGGLRLRQQYNDWAPTGIPYDPYGLGYPSYYLGAAGYPARRERLHHHAGGHCRKFEPTLAASRPGDLSVRRHLSRAVVVPDQHQLRFMPKPTTASTRS